LSLVWPGIGCNTLFAIEMMSATAAYRKDLAGHGSPFGERDGEWITVASLVSSAADANADADGVEQKAWLSAIDAAVHALGHTELDRLSAREWGAGWSDFDPLTLIAVAMHQAGARDLSSVVLDALLRVRRGVPDLAYGRALAERARVAYFAGEYEVAEDFYNEVDRIGRRLSSVELRARATNGFSSLAQVRGNHPRMLEFATQGLALAEQTAVPRLRWNARYAIMLSSAVFRRYDDALVHGWELFNLARGDALGEARALHALGQLLLEMGDIDAARSAFTAVVSRALPPVPLLAALGSLASATALSPTHRETLEWAVTEVERFRRSRVSPWAYADALLDCVVALRDVSELPRARSLLDEVLAITKAHGFHALQFRAEAIELRAVTSRPERARVAANATEVVRLVRRLAPPRLPRHVRMTAARG
jgi:tetratricopeptide (TPR) repeat protein